MGLKFNRQDARLGAIPAGCYVTDTTSTTPRPLALPNRAVDWDILPSGGTGSVLTVNADGSIGWSPAGSGTGTVTSVSWTGDGTIFTATADTAVTTSGTLTPASLIAQVENTLFAGPATGSNAAPTFRALAAADLPTTSLAINSCTSLITVDTPAAGAVTCNLATSNWHQITFAASTTITLSNVGTNQQFTLIIIQGGSGSYTATFSGMTIKWPGGTAPTLTTAVGGIDVLTFKQVGAAGNYYGFVAGQALA
jgi:hypothetical protein